MDVIPVLLWTAKEREYVIDEQNEFGFRWLFSFEAAW